MSDHHHGTVPRGPLLAVGALVAMSLLLVGVARTTGIGTTQTPQMSVVAERELRFADQRDGSITVHDARTDELLEEVAPGTNGFLRGALRGLARERKRQGIGQEPAFRVSGRSDGRLLLEDPSTGRLIDLGSFGATNAAVFMRLLHADKSAPGERLALRMETGTSAATVADERRPAPPSAVQSQRPS